MPFVTDISWYRGEDVNLRVSMVPETNITGWALAFALKQNYGDTATLISKTSGAGQITFIDAILGIFNVAIGNADTASLTPRRYVYDVQKTDSGMRSVLCVGDAVLKPEVQV